MKYVAGSSKELECVTALPSSSGNFLVRPPLCVQSLLQPWLSGGYDRWSSG
jgi:hypothetical protein